MPDALQISVRGSGFKILVAIVVAFGSIQTGVLVWHQDAKMTALNARQDSIANMQEKRLDNAIGAMAGYTFMQNERILATIQASDSVHMADITVRIIRIEQAIGMEHSRTRAHGITRSDEIARTIRTLSAKVDSLAVVRPGATLPIQQQDEKPISMPRATPKRVRR